MSLLELLLDEADVPQTAHDALVVARYAASNELARAAKQKAARILKNELDLSCEELQTLLDL